MKGGIIILNKKSIFKFENVYDMSPEAAIKYLSDKELILRR